MFRYILYPFLPYRSFAGPILSLIAIVLPCWLIFRLYRRRTSAHSPPLRREILLLTFVLYLAGLAAVTLTTNHNSGLDSETTVGMELLPSLASLTCSSPTLPVDSRARSFCLRNAAGNVMLFVPLGLLIPLVWSRLRFWKGMQIALALSCGIEVVQYLSRGWGSNRSADVNDIVLNVSGACLGLAVVFLLRLRRGAGHAVPSD